MAQRTVHYVFGRILGERFGITDMPRFLLGSLLPDAFARSSERNAAHFAFQEEDGTRFYDFERFRLAFAGRMPQDPLYLGYYMHLVEDNLYRRFCHVVHDFWFITEEEVRALHRDYHLLNPFLVEHYGLKNELEIPADLSGEPVSRVTDFDLSALKRETAQDFTEHPEGEAFLLTPEIMVGFIEQNLPLAEAEMRAVLEGGICLRAADFAWKKK